MVLERLDAAARHPDNQFSQQQVAIERARNLLIEAGVKDPGPRITRSSFTTDRAKISSGFCSKDAIGSQLFESSAGGCG